VNKSQLVFALAACLIVGFAAGFFFANRANRQELDRLQAEIARVHSAHASSDETKAGNNATTNTEKTSLTDDQLRAVIAKADARPDDHELQRKAGQGLYLYAVQFGKPDLLPEAIRILKRAHDVAPQDYDTTVILGNALFDLARATDPKRFKEARAYFTQALKQKPDDINVRTELGATYYFDTPADPRRAISEYRKSLAQDPRHEMTLQSLVAALISTGELAEAEQRLNELQQVNAANPALSDLRAQLAQQRNAAGGAK